MKKSEYQNFNGNWKQFYNCNYPIVYCITNNINNTLYIGISVKISKRLRDYGSAIKSNKQYSDIQVICRALKKYGACNFSFDVIKIYDNIDQCKCEEIEQIRYLKERGVKLYNMTDGGDIMSINHKSGEEIYNASLTNADIGIIFDMHHNQNYYAKEIAKELKIHPDTIYKVLKGKTYKKISQPLYLQYGDMKPDTSCKTSGLDNYQAKFTTSQIEEFFKLYHIDFLSTEDIAKQFNTDRGTIHRILTGKGYKSISSKFVEMYGKLRKCNWKIDYDANRGSLNHKSKLQNEDVIYILKLKNNGCSANNIANLYSISVNTVYAIINNKTWKHVTNLKGNTND